MNLSHSRDRRERERMLAVGAFLAGLPDFHRGRIVTASSDIDSWRRKPPALERRIAAASRLREVRA